METYAPLVMADLWISDESNEIFGNVDKADVIYVNDNEVRLFIVSGSIADNSSTLTHTFQAVGINARVEIRQHLESKPMQWLPYRGQHFINLNKIECIDFANRERPLVFFQGGNMEVDLVDREAALAIMQGFII